jgi:hypothetical protein
MDDFLLQIFAGEAATQCRLILLAARDLERERAGGSVYGIWKEIQTILMASANLSKIFWGSRGALEGEREPLRAALEVEGDSPLRDPDLRNDFEHFDERLERRFSDPDVPRTYVGRNIGPHAAYDVGDDAGADRFHHFDPESGIVTFWDHSVQIRDAIAEAQRILPLAEQVAEPHRGPE